MNPRWSLCAGVPLVLAGVLAGGVGHADPPPDPDAHRSVYRFEFTVTGLDDSPRTGPATMAINLQENTPGAAASGANVPLTTPVMASGNGAAGMATAPARQDVGLSVRGSYGVRGSMLVLVGNVEISSAEAPTSTTAAAIHRVRLDGVAPITPGTPVVFGTVTDPTTHRRVEVSVTARRLL